MQRNVDLAHSRVQHIEGQPQVSHFWPKPLPLPRGDIGRQIYRCAIMDVDTFIHWTESAGCRTQTSDQLIIHLEMTRRFEGWIKAH
jgi:hypothetical protein